jgi:hypothetical protein
MTDEYVVSRRYDWSDVSPVIGVVEVLSDAEDTDPNEIPALAGTVDPESLNELCSSAPTGDPVTVSFAHAGYDVIVRSDGFVGVDTA